MKALSLDLRERIAAAYDAGGVTQQQVAERFSVSVESVKKLLRQRRELGTLEAQTKHSGRHPYKIFAHHRERFIALIEEQPDITLEELRAQTGLECSLMAIWKTLKHLDYSYKKNLARQ